jgi:hypothetical protein
MKIALVCIAKNEDKYINEWVDYHIKLGFDSIFIYENDWDSNIERDNVYKIPFNGLRQQIPSYNHFIRNYRNDYDWVAFLDVDEFLVLKKHNNIHEFISEYQDYSSIGINWVLFGDNGLESTDGDGVLRFFTKRQKPPNEHIKSIVKIKDVSYMHVHHHSGQAVDTSLKRIDNSPYNYNGPIDVAQINHYFVKTKSEFEKKINRGRADTGTFRDMSHYDRHNFNEVEDLTALNFYQK